MEKSHADYLELLKSFVLESPPSLSEDINWDEILRLARINGTYGIIGYLLMQDPSLSNPALQEHGKKACFKEGKFFLERLRNMIELSDRMNQSGIDHLLFKGIIVRDWYPIPELRTYGDIDFVIRREDRQKSNELMLEMGYELHNNWEPVYSYKKGPEYYEIHTEIMEIDVSDKADYIGYFSHPWDHAILQVADERAYEFQPEYHLLFLLTHIAKHLHGSGAGIRMYMDIACFLRYYEGKIDWDYIENELKVLKFEEFGNIVFTGVERWFGIRSPILLRPVDEEMFKYFTDFTLEGGVFGFVGRDHGLNSLKNLDEQGEKVSRFTAVIRQLFPAASTIESRYTYLQGHHWLLPIAWLHRFFLTRKTWGEHARMAKRILNADEEQILKMRKFHKSLGL